MAEQESTSGRALRTGARLGSAVCSTEVMVIATPDAAVDLRCGGAPLLDLEQRGEPSASPAPDAAGGTLIGKRYVNADGSLELLCTKAGEGSLSADGEALTIKGAKPLPSSD